MQKFTTLVLGVCTALAATFTAHAQDSETDTLNHFFLGFGTMGALSAPLTIRSDVNGSGTGMGAAYTRDFEAPSGGEFFVAYEAPGRGLVRLSWLIERVTGITSSYILSDAQYKPVAMSSTQSWLTSNTVALGFDQFILQTDKLNLTMNASAGVLFVGADKLVTSINNAGDGATTTSSSTIVEGFSKSVSPVLSAGFGARYALKNFNFELRGAYTLTFNTKYVSTLTLSEMQNGVPTILGTHESSRNLDGFRCGLFMSYRLW